MPLERIQVQDVRCLRHIDCCFDPEWNLVFGPNGAGKTSLLESIYLLGRGRSFRTRHTERLIRHGQPGLTVHGSASAGGRRSRIGVKFRQRSLDIRVNEQPCRSMVGLAEALPVHLLDPNIHELIEAGPAVRRRFLDGGVFHVEHRYLDIWRDYRKVLGQRNAALKHGRSAAALDAWNRSLLDAGQNVHRARAEYAERLAARVTAFGQRLLGRPIEVAYRPGWRQDIDFDQALREALERDRAAGFTQVGPHRADLRLSLDSGSVRDEVSRGQQKMIAAALVLAQVELIAEARGERGVLLADDPAAELDREALARLLGELRKAPAQLILTGLSAEVFDPPAGRPLFHVEHGRLTPVV